MEPLCRPLTAAYMGLRMRQFMAMARCPWTVGEAVAMRMELMSTVVYFAGLHTVQQLP